MILAGPRKAPEVSYQVRYQGGRKQFAKLNGTDPAVHARAFATEQRSNGGWAEIARVTTEIVERRR